MSRLSTMPLDALQTLMRRYDGWADLMPAVLTVDGVDFNLIPTLWGRHVTAAPVSFAYLHADTVAPASGFFIEVSFDPLIVPNAQRAAAAIADVQAALKAHLATRREEARDDPGRVSGARSGSRAQAAGGRGGGTAAQE